MTPPSEYRYRLERDLGGEATLLFVMMNPSTADETADDPTIRRCKSFAAGYGRLEVVNLFALRATNPQHLTIHPDPVGPSWSSTVEAALASASGVVFAWGAIHSKWNLRRAQVDRVRAMADEAGLTPACLGQTLDGSPRHPLYVKGDQPLVAWEPLRFKGANT